MRLSTDELSPGPLFQLAQRDLASDGASGVVTYCAVDTGGCHIHTSSTGVPLAKAAMPLCVVSTCE